jgi:lysophospholipase L1-like esterase
VGARHDGGGADARADHGAMTDASPRDSTVDAPGDAAPDAAIADAPAEADVVTPVDSGHDSGHDSGIDAGPPALRYIGRTLTDGTNLDGNGPCTALTPCFEWSGTEIVARFTGASAIDFTMSDYGNYFDVYVDGALQPGTIIGDPSQTSYSVATGLDPTKVHEVSLYKRTEASLIGRTQAMGVTFPDGGTLLPPAPGAARRIEVLGDSISCGYGVLGPDATCTETPALEDHDDTYGAITARTLDADLYTIASSGRGVYRNADGTLTTTLPDIYGLALPYVSSGTPSAWDFATWVPDAVVIDLGTNDFVDGDPGAAFVTAYTMFLEQIRHNYPGAYILCTNGPMLADADYTTAAMYIQSAIAAVGDARIAYLAFPTQMGDEGCDGHPDVTTQAAMATRLAPVLKAALGW